MLHFTIRCPNRTLRLYMYFITSYISCKILSTEKMKREAFDGDGNRYIAEKGMEKKDEI